MMGFRLSATIAAGLVVLLVPNIGRAAVTEDNFMAKTAGDIAALCSAAPTDKLYTAAMNFCHGFGAGTYGVLAEVQQANPKLKLFCNTNDVTRNEAVAAFVAWVGKQPGREVMPAVDGVTAFLTQTYPCPNTAAAAKSGRMK